MVNMAWNLYEMAAAGCQFICNITVHPLQNSEFVWAFFGRKWGAQPTKQTCRQINLTAGIQIDILRIKSFRHGITIDSTLASHVYKFISFVLKQQRQKTKKSN